MPRPTTKVCLEPGCPELTERGESRCEPHRLARQRTDDKRRGTAAERGYDARWRRIRKAFLAAAPFCIDCGGIATVADHDPIPRRVLVEQGVRDPDAFHRLKPRCARCHGRKTYGVERTQYGKPRGSQ